MLQFLRTTLFADIFYQTLRPTNYESQTDSDTPLDAVCLSVTRSPRENEPDQTSGLLDELEMGGARRGHVGG